MVVFGKENKYYIMEEIILLDSNNPIIKGHKVQDGNLLPGMAYIDIIFNSLKERGVGYKGKIINDLLIYNPLKVDLNETVELCISHIDDDKLINLTGIGASSKDNKNVKNEKCTYCSAYVNDFKYNESVSLDISTISNMQKIISLEELYAKCRNSYLVHSGSMKAEGDIYETEHDIVIKTTVNCKESGLMFHPAIFDICAIAGGWWQLKTNESLYLPISFTSFFSTKLVTANTIYYGRILKKSIIASNEMLYFDIDLFDDKGILISRIVKLGNKLVRSTGNHGFNENCNRSNTFELNAVIDAVKNIFAEELKISTAQIFIDRGYYDMGISSSLLLSINKKINVLFDCDLAPTLLFEYTTIYDLSQYLVEKTQKSNAMFQDISMHNRKDSFKRSVKQYDTEENEKIAIIGMSGRYPQADNSKVFWENLKQGKDCITEIPLSRWDWRSFQNIITPLGRNISHWGGFVENPYHFDPYFFNISPIEAERMDPQERLFLEVCWESIEDAGYTLENLSKICEKKVGVFAGVMHRDYSLIGADILSKEQIVPLALNGASVANRVSYCLDFNGPSIVIDTVCSSSLTSLHLAIESLRRKECLVALAGGVNLSLHPAKYLTYGMANMFSSDGRCRSFSNRGDGYVSGEGVGVLLLKPLKQAVVDHDNIYAVIKVSSINHVGKVSGFTVPSPTAQANVISDCLERGNIDPRTITYIEAHGTGTLLGDPIEIEGLTKAFRKYTNDKQFCSIGSVKSNIGHSESAAGIIGVQKTICQLYHKVLVKSLHSETLNPNIDFDNSPFVVQQVTTPWSHSLLTPRRAAVSAFGATGSNAHVILEEYIPEPKLNEGSPQLVLIPISAKTDESLFRYVETIYDYLKGIHKTTKMDIHSVMNDLKTILCRQINVSPDFIDAECDLFDLGIDIIHWDKIRDNICCEFNLEIEIGDLLRCKSISEIARYIINSASSLGYDFEFTLIDFAYTLQVGREAMKKRIAFLVSNFPELCTKLEAFLSKKANTHHFWIEQQKESQEEACTFRSDVNLENLMKNHILNRDLEQIALMWCQGYDIDWQNIYDELPYRMSLPTYPFNNKDYKILDIKPTTTIDDKGNMHPFLQDAVYEGNSLKCMLTLDKSQIYVKDHCVNNGYILPGVVCLEMAHAAGILLFNIESEEHVVCLEDVYWINPILVEASNSQIILECQFSNERLEFKIYNKIALSSENLLCCQGFLKTMVKTQLKEIDINVLKGKCNIAEISKDRCYTYFRKIGIDYGLSFQCVDYLFLGKNEILASLSVSEKYLNELSVYVLFPGLVDAALHSSIGLNFNVEVNNFSSHIEGAIMPFSLSCIEVLKPCEQNMWAHIVWDKGVQSNITPILDIILYNERGEACCILKGFVMRPFSSNNEKSKFDVIDDGNLTLLPNWAIFNGELLSENINIDNESLIIVGDDNDDLVLSIRDHFSTPYILNFSVSEEVVFSLDENQSVKHIIWIAPCFNYSSIISDEICDQSAYIAKQLFSFIKRISSKYKKQKLEWTFITREAQPIFSEDSVSIPNSGILGLIGTIAKEYLLWEIRAVDITPAFFDSNKILSIFQLPTDKQGHLYVWRNNNWYKHELLPVRLYADSANDQKTAYKEHGVYVIIGGTGEVGYIWSKYMINKYKAQIIWIGRSALNNKIEEKINNLSKLGPKPFYINADASNYYELADACTQIRDKFGFVNGVIHSAMILSENKLEDMSFEQYIETFQTKASIAVRIAQTFDKDKLDFILFFSSLISFVKNAKQGHYASGCMFADIYAHQLSQQLSCNVKVMNWGFWNRIDSSISDSFKRLEKIGISVIKEEDGMAALEFLLSSPFHQLAFMKADHSVTIEGVNRNKEVWLLRSGSVENMDITADVLKEIHKNCYNINIEKREFISVVEKINSIIKKMLWIQLDGLRIWNNQHISLSQFPATIETKFLRWLEECCNEFVNDSILLRENGLYNIIGPLNLDKDEVWDEWDRIKSALGNKFNLHPQLELIEAILSALPDILIGKRTATNIIFPDSSMNLVEGVYQNNYTSDYFANIVADVVVAYLLKSSKQKLNSKIRIIEIGAGTGGTTSVVLSKIELYKSYIDKYCYTDISKSFLLYAEEKYGQMYDFLSFEMFNIENELEDISQVGTYDIVIAANVLHATKNISNTIFNVKSLLKDDGICVLQEISSKSLVNHLIFGLLDGWWMFEDFDLRIPGSPGIYSDNWEVVLKNRGFKNIFFPVESDHDLGQQIIVGQSDGVIIFNKNNSKEKPSNTCSFTKESVRIDDENLLQQTYGYVKVLISKTLKVPTEEIDVNERLEKYGIDSIFIVQMTSELKKHFPDVTTTIFFDNQTVADLSSYLIDNMREHLLKALGVEDSKYIKTETTKLSLNLSDASIDTEPENITKKNIVLNGYNATNNKDVAVIGMAGRYPNAENLSEYWDNLKNGINCISEIPENRWNWRNYYGEKGKEGAIYTKWGGFIDNHDMFDSRFFNISPKEAEGMDPQERIFLETAYACIEDAGYTPDNLCRNNKVGVFVGVMNSYYPTGASYWSIANRVSFLFDFHGPSMAIDTACSSSLTALHLALESLNSGTSNCVIVGGVNLIINPFHSIKLSYANMLSSGNECKAFGEGADGFVDSEGVGAIILKPLSEAIRDHDHIYGVVKSSMINAGGRTNGYSVPNPRMQTELILNSLEKCNITPRSISYIEAHGTGTSLGDPIEIASLTKAFQHYTQDRQFCAIGSVKSNIGHSEGAAGIASVIKVLLQLKHKQLVPSLHSENTNSNINFESSPFFVQHSLEDWEKPILTIGQEKCIYPRIASVSAFGAGGTNVNIIIKEHDTNFILANKDYKGKVIIVLSAKNKDSLCKKTVELLSALNKGSFCDEDLVDIAYTLQIGREAMQERIAMCVSSISELTAKLENIANGVKEDYGNVYYGIDSNFNLLLLSFDEDLDVLLDLWIEKENLDKLAKIWALGAKVDWHKLYLNVNKPKRISLPTYPFVREKYWIKNGYNGVNELFNNEVGEKTDFSISSVPNSRISAVSNFVLDIFVQITKHKQDYIQTSLIKDLGIDSILNMKIVKYIVDESLNHDILIDSSCLLEYLLRDDISFNDLVHYILSLQSMDKKNTGDMVEVVNNVKSDMVNITCANIRIESEFPLMVLGDVVVNEKHPFFFDHQLDHVSGMHLIESVSQLVKSYLMHINKVDDSFISEMSFSFDKFCKKETLSRIRVVNANTYNVQSEFSVEILQESQVIGKGVVKMSPIVDVLQDEKRTFSLERNVACDKYIVNKHNEGNVLVSNLVFGYDIEDKGVYLYKPSLLANGFFIDSQGPNLDIVVLLEACRQSARVFTYHEMNDHVKFVNAPKNLILAWKNVKINISQPINKEEDVFLRKTKIDFLEIGENYLVEVKGVISVNGIDLGCYSMESIAISQAFSNNLKK